MSNSVFISICIPAYKHVDYLKRLLDSILSQSFVDFEIIITDDSNDNSVRDLVLSYKSFNKLVYHKNEQPLGSPENWNAGIKLAKGEWLKIMHDDDWFADENTLQEFVIAAKNNNKARFIFSGFTEVDLHTGRQKNSVINKYYEGLLRKTPLVLFKENYIGHPSTTLIKNDRDVYFNKNFRWVVDIEFYIRYLTKHPNFLVIQKPLIKIGISEFQITKQAFRNPAIEVPEVLGLLHELPPNSLQNIFMYDYYWRFIRNLSIRSLEDIKRYAPNEVIPQSIINMVNVQARWSPTELRKGVLSKSLMFTSYLRYRYETRS